MATSARTASTRRASSPAEPVCGFTLDGKRCRQRGPHRCAPRVRHVVAFFAELLVHTKGDYARRAFVPARWQVERILAPLFGEVTWDAKRRRYVRRYRTLYLLIPRKNGKTELLAGIVLYLLCADGEEGAEVYGLALDKDQAGFVYNVAARMVDLSPALSRRLQVLRSTSRIIDQRTGSFYAVTAGDDKGALGSNPHGAYIDELLTQPSRDLYDALRTGMGTRAQPVLMMATTAEADPSGFAASERSWSERVAADPSLDPTRLVVIYAAPAEADWRAEATWRRANPALGDFLDVEVLRVEAARAYANPVEENSFRQYRLNQPPRALSRVITFEAWDEGRRDLAEAELAGRRCFGGLDLASTSDLAAVAWTFPGEPDEGPVTIWRHFAPEAALADLDRRTAGAASVWAATGWLTLTEGNVIDYRAITERIGRDAELFDVAEVAYDRWGMTQLSQDLAEAGLEVIMFGQGFASMSAPTRELLRLIAAGLYGHLGDPVARWEASNLILRSDPAGNLKPDKGRAPDKIDGIVAAVMALDRTVRWAEPEPEPVKRYRAIGF